MREITTEAELRDVLGFPAGRAITKERTALHPRDRQWLAASPFCLVATAGADGSCDVSPKGDPPGFTHVLDDTTIAIPDRYGNRRADGFRNILANPHVGVIVKGHRPVLALLVEIEQIFFHCMKAFMRSQLWEPHTWAPDAFPSHAELVKSIQPTGETLEELEQYYGPSYAKGLYG